jgi:hypothetical protein
MCHCISDIVISVHVYEARYNLLSSHLCLGLGTEEKTSVHILCECEALASLRHIHLVSFLLDPEDIRKLSIGAIWNFGNGTGLL